jgi:hypothetical protein
MTILRRSSDPQYHASILQQWGQRQRKHPACDDLATACDACFLPLLAELVANEVLATHGPGISDSDRAGILPDSDALQQTAIRPREPTAAEAAGTVIKPKKPAPMARHHRAEEMPDLIMGKGQEVAATEVRAKGKRRATQAKSRDEMLAEVRAYIAKKAEPKK